MHSKYLKEACVQTIEEAEVAQKLGADRLEYCSHLELDGLTPDIQDFESIFDSIHIPIMVMIRPRAGDFEYSDAEFEEMKSSIHEFKALNIAGFVFGIVKNDAIDFERTKILAEISFPFEICFHKAIDVVANPIDAIKKLNEIPQITRVLTSGKSKTAEKGAPIIKEMIKVARPTLSIMPAGKIKASNIEILHKKLKAKEYHGRSILMHF